MPDTEVTKPIYLSLSRLDRLLDLISTRSLNEVTLDYLRAQGFKGTDAHLAFAGLRFLGIIDASGKTLEISKKLHLQGDAWRETLKEVINVAYTKLFKVNKEAFTLDRQQLTNEFVGLYGLTPRIARVATPAFIFLCEKAGFIEQKLKIKTTEEGARRPRRERVPSALGSNNSPRITSTIPSGTIPFPFANGKIQLIITQTDQITELVQSEEFGTVSNAIKQLAEKFYIHKDDPE